VSIVLEVAEKLPEGLKKVCFEEVLEVSIEIVLAVLGVLEVLE